MVLKMSQEVLSLGQFKADASRLLDQVRDQPATLVLTQNGRARAVVQDYEQYQARERAMLMLKLLAEGERDLAMGHSLPHAEVFDGLRQQLRSQRANADETDDPAA